MGDECCCWFMAKCAESASSPSCVFFVCCTHPEKNTHPRVFMCTLVVGRTHTIVRLQTRIRRKMERRISGVSYMCCMDFHNEILCCGFLCARLISVSFSGSLPQRGLPRPTALFSGYHAEGYHARTDAFELTGYLVCRVTTPELPRSIQTSGYRRVITPAGSF